MCGTRGDPLKAIEYMPGVGRSPQANFVIIRGSSPADSRQALYRRMERLDIVMERRPR